MLHIYLVVSLGKFYCLKVQKKEKITNASFLVDGLLSLKQLKYVFLLTDDRPFVDFGTPETKIKHLEDSLINQDNLWRKKDLRIFRSDHLIILCKNMFILIMILDFMGVPGDSWLYI